MSRHLHELVPRLNSIQAVVQIPTDSAPATAEMIKEITEDEDRGFNQSSQSPAGEKQLTWDEWKDVIQRRSILCGIRMETRLNNRLGPDVSGVSLVCIHSEVSLS